MGDKQHDPDRNRIFVRALEGKYTLNAELDRLRAMPRVIKGKDLKLDGIRRNFKLEVLEADPRNEALELRVTVRTGEGGRVETTSTEFWLDYFDFPMIDNTRLPHDQRFAVVLNNFDAAGGSADITLAFFPGKYTGLREKPYYDEVLTKLLSESERRGPAGSEPTPIPK